MEKIKEGNLVVHAGPEFAKQIEKEVGEQIKLDDKAVQQVVDMLAESTAKRVITTPEQAQEVLKEIEAQADLTPEQVALEKQKYLKDVYAKMEEIWKNMSRKQRRNMIKPGMKFSDRVRKMLKDAK